MPQTGSLRVLAIIVSFHYLFNVAGLELLSSAGALYEKKADRRLRLGVSACIDK